MKKQVKKLKLAKETLVTMEDLARADGGTIVGNPPNSVCCNSVNSECFV